MTVFCMFMVAVFWITFGRIVVMKMKKIFAKKNMAKNPPKTHDAVRSTECNWSAASGKKWSRAMPSMRPATRLMAICSRSMGGTDD